MYACSFLKNDNSFEKRIDNFRKQRLQKEIQRENLQYQRECQAQFEASNSLDDTSIQIAGRQCHLKNLRGASFYERLVVV